MKNIIFYTIIAVSIVFFNSCKDEGEAKYKNPDLPIEDRINDLLNRMTVEEKARQLDMYTAIDLVTDQKFDEAKMDSVLGGINIGSFHDLYPLHAQLPNDIQKYLVEKTRLGIPAFQTGEALHGYSGSEGTCFPAPIGMGAMWDTTLMRKIGQAIGTEARSHGVHFVLSPVLGLAREPRWGRVEETYGEDPYLAAQIGKAMIKGMQGNSFTDNNSVISEPKHYAIHSIPESGTNNSPVQMGEREARETFLYPWEVAIKEAKAHGVMAAYHDWDGIPVVASPFLLKKLLREEWGFEGMVLSDLGAIKRQNIHHFTAKTPKDAITKSIQSGVDMQFMDFSHEVFQQSIIDAVEDGSLTIEELDRAVITVLRLKFLLGLFENPYTDTSLVAKVHHSKEHQELALEAGRKSICLLKNDHNILPFSKDIKSITVLGALANTPSIGGYSPRDVKAVTILEGIKRKLGDQVEIHYKSDLIPTDGLTIVDSSFLRTPDNKHYGLLAEYYNNNNFEGKPDLTRIETYMSPFYPDISPGGVIQIDLFTVRWTGTITAPVSGVYDIGIIYNDKGRLYINNKLHIDDWEFFESDVMKTKRYHFKAGQAVPIRMELGDDSWHAGIRMKWQLVEPDKGYLVLMEKEILAAVNKSDITVLVVGETKEVVGEGKDKSNLNLNSTQLEIAKIACAAGKPLAIVLLNGRPLCINWIAENAPAIVEAWYPGEKGGDAVADVLFGDFNPSGKLSVTIPKSTGQLPVFYNHKPSARRGYVDGDSEPLFHFGHGLSYTTFKYSHLKIDSETISLDGSATISVDVKNTGEREGTEIVQLYINDQISSVVTPIIELKGFAKVSLKAGETKTVHLKLTPKDLALWNADMKEVVEPGDFDIMIGASSNDIRLRGILKVIE